MFAGMETGCIMDWELKNGLSNICFHQGRTDLNGGHHDWLNRMGWGFGCYHYHHKLPAHLHPHGICPYGELKASIMNPYTGKKIDLGMPYFYADNPYFSLNLVSRALTADDELGVDLTDKDTGGSFHACFTGDSSKKEGLGEQIFFTYPEGFFGIQNNAFFKTGSNELQLLCHTKKSAADNTPCYAYISLETIGVYMTKDGYFTDFCDDGSGVWKFNVRKPGVQIITPQNGGLFHVGDELTVEANIENVSRAALIVGNTFFGYTDGFSEYKYNLDRQSTVTFSKFKLTEDQAGSLPVRVEVHTGGTAMQADIDAHTISSGLRIRVVGPGESMPQTAKDLNDEEKLFIATIYAETSVCSNQAGVAVANVIMNRVENVGTDEWKKYSTVTDIIKFTGFDAYKYDTDNYKGAMDYLNNLDTKNEHSSNIDKLIEICIPVYEREVEDIANGSVYYFSPIAQRKLHESNPSLYPAVPSFITDDLEVVIVPGCENDDLRFYKFK